MNKRLCIRFMLSPGCNCECVEYKVRLPPIQQGLRLTRRRSLNRWEKLSADHYATFMGWGWIVLSLFPSLLSPSNHCPWWFLGQHTMSHTVVPRVIHQGALSLGTFLQLYENEGAVHAYRLSDRFFSQMMLFDNGWHINKSKYDSLEKLKLVVCQKHNVFS